ncbi:AraC-like DNA-binding protein [Kordia periserrulae]|uniref:AraC-like DNA-binding protein n=1 Tax=Kordia periserrulae TaxID=701523 RepID=A0A2T6C7D7_9FLAO|nr:helix-turn-helix domain-containing protein [Kordia periserrulae]PTX64217.1 AraC-like DNA-binding protein [Kordia periserrulae]
MNRLNSACYVFLFLSLFSFNGYAQAVQKDTLDNKSFDELKKIFYYHKDLGEIKVGKEIALYTLSKARSLGNKKAIVNSFIRLCRVSYDDLDLALKYTDSCILYATEYEFEKLLAEGHFYRGIVLYELGKYGNALEAYLKANEYYKKQKNEMYYSLRYNIGLLKLKVRYHAEAIEIFKENLKFEKGKDVNSKSYLDLLYGLSIAYASNKMLDSAYEINKIGYQKSLKLNDQSHLYFTYAQGALHYARKEYKAAKDSMLKAVPYLMREKDYPNLAIIYYYLGTIAKNEEIKIEYFKKVDSIFGVKKYIIPKPRKAYEGLIDYYKKKGDLKKQLYYTERLMIIDTVINKEHRNVTHTFQHEYDTPRLVEDKRLLIQELNKKNTDFKYGIYILLIFLVLVISLLIAIYRKKRINEKRFREVLKSLESTPKIKQVGQSNREKRKSVVDENTLNHILEGLDEFEKNKAFLTPKLTLSSFAKELNTNTKYLSIVINDYKSQTFRNYINNLRIEYIIGKLYNDQVLRNYTISAIASEAGFSSTESFTRAFTKKTGLNVSYYMKKIK